MTAETRDPPAMPPTENGTVVQSTSSAARSEERTKVMAVYALYLASFVTGVTVFVGIVLAYVFRGEADPVMRSHYDNATGVFWKGILYSVACALLTLTVVGAVSWIVLAVWFGVRCVKGLLKANEGEAYPNPKGWGF